MSSKIRLLEATLRDGGQGLDDLYNNGFSDKYYTEDMKHRVIDLLGESNVEIIELGAMGPSADDKSKFAIYQNVEVLSRYLPENRDPQRMYVGLYIGPDTDIEKIPDWNPSLVKGIRVILRYSELKKSLDYCAALAKKGYTMFVQPMLTMRYSDKELDMVLGMTNDMGAFACYFVDSYGYMEPQDIHRLFKYFDTKLHKDIRIGFHAHNNMNLAYSNVISFINVETDRELLIDACATGMGQGAGNLQTELIVPYLNEHFGKHYNYEPILEICDIFDDKMVLPNLWGYSVTRLLPAVYKTAYKYALVMRNKYHLSFKQMNQILRDMPDDMRNRYTKDNIEQLLSTIQ
jgi:4-hydroxy 2-oxovalerate aldolase